MRKAMMATVVMTAVAAASAWGQTTMPAPRANGAENSAGAATETKSAEVPVKRVVLFSSGVGFFEHEGMVEGNAATPLRFEAAQINDVLKSLMVFDRDGGVVRNVTYSANDPVNKTLKSFQVDLSGNPPLADLINQMRGVEISISVGDETIVGKVLGVESRDESVGKGDAAKVISKSVVNVISPEPSEGIRSVALDDVRKIWVKDDKIRKELGQALAAIAEARDQSKKVVTVNFEGTGKRRVGVGYLVETPVWKMSYRLMLPDATSKDTAKLQGWAIVENQTDNDWTDVSLSLVGGRPLGFIELLYQPLYNPRPVVRPDIAASLHPQTYEGGQNAAGAGEEGQGVHPPTFDLTAVTQNGSTSGGGGGSSGSLFSAPGASVIGGFPMTDYSQGVASIAQMNKIGEMFHYNVEKVTLPRQQSSMIPIITESVDYDRVSIYNPDVLAQHPLHGVRLKNNTQKYLLGGPVTVLDTVKEGTSYAGDAMIDDIPPGQSRLLSYAVDQDMAGDLTKDTSEMNLMGASVAKGILKLSFRNRHTWEYSLQNKAAGEKTVVVETPALANYELTEPAKGTEKAENSYRFQLTVAGMATGKLRVVQEQATRQTEGILGLGAAPLVLYLKEGAISDKVKDFLRTVAAKRDEMAKLDAQYRKKQEDRSRILEEQANIRENIRVLPAGSKSQQDAVNDLGTHDADLKQTTTEMRDLQDAQEKAKAEFEKFVAEAVMD